MSGLLRCPGHLLCRQHEGVRRIYHLQTFIDIYTIAKLYDRATPIIAADLIKDRVVPFYDAHEVELSRVLTDRGSDCCGNLEHHEDELYLLVGDIDQIRDNPGALK